MRCHEVDYEIIGDDMQVVEIELDPGETVIAEAGAMNWMEDGIRYETKMGDGSNPTAGIMGKLLGAGKRVLTGESIFLTHFSNRDRQKRHVAFAAPYPGKIIPVNLGQGSGELICQKDAFLCAAFGTQLNIAFTKRLGAGFFGGEGLFCSASRGTVSFSYTLAVQLLKKSCTTRCCVSIPAVSSLLARKSSIISSWSVI
jgi:uncharacterized protein (AIM24 family)